MSQSPTLLSMRDVCRITSLSRTAINKLRAKGTFPAAVSLGERRFAFVQDEVTAWVNERMARRTSTVARDHGEIAA